MADKKFIKGVSPVVATVLLVAMTIVIALIVFLWFRGLGTEVITKFGGENVQLVCGDVEFNAEYTNDKIRISNTGNVPIFGMKVKIDSESGNYYTEDIEADLDSSWPDLGLDTGGVFTSEDLSNEFSAAEKITLVPVLLGVSKKGQRPYTCNEKQHGYEISIF